MTMDLAGNVGIGITENIAEDQTFRQWKDRMHRKFVCNLKVHGRLCIS